MTHETLPSNGLVFWVWDFSKT